MKVSEPAEGSPATTESRTLLAQFRGPDPRRSILEVAVTLPPFAALWAAMALLLANEVWWGLLLAVPAAAFLVRLFMIQHDCGHGAFFRSRGANDWLGRFIGVFTLTPYDQWRRAHASHHATVGNLARRGIGDIHTMTVAEYLASGPRARFAYRFVRHPLVLFGLAPAFLFILQNRVPSNPIRGGWQEWQSPLLTNAVIAVLALAGCLALGPPTFLAIQLPIVLLSASAGVWLFYVQHQFEETSWRNDESWTHSEASLHGSSFYDLPQPLRWFTADIGIHHVHHLSSRIPFYRLAEAMRAYPDLASTGRLTLLTSLRCIPLALWDEETQRLVSFRKMWALERDRRTAAATRAAA